MAGAEEGGGSRPPWFAVCAVATAALLCVAGVVSPHAQPSRVALWLLLAGAPYLALASAPLPARMQGDRWPVLLAAVPGVCMVLGHSALSDDLYRFAWDARVWLSGRDAYEFAPASPALAGLRDDRIWPRINHATIPTIYPPIAQALFVLGYGPLGLAGLKALALLGHLVTTAAVARLARLAGAGREGPRAAWLWALNPLALSESALAGHYDVWLGLLLLGVAAALHRQRTALSSVLTALAAGLKLVGLFILPVFVRRNPRAALLVATVSVGLSLPLLLAGRGDDSVSGIGHFGQRWQGNAGLFKLVELVAEPVVVGLASDVGGTGHQRIGADELAFDYLRPLLVFLHAHGFDPGGALATKRMTPRPLGVFPRDHAVGLAARAAVVACVLAVAFVCGRRPGMGALRPVVLTLLLLSPQVHPWYLLWLLPLELAQCKHVALVWSLAVLATYAPLDAWDTVRSWREAPLWVAFEYALVLACLGWESRVILRTSLTRLGQRFKLEGARNPR